VSKSPAGTYLAAAAEAALRAGAIQKARYGTSIAIEHKGAIDLVTEVDRACEEEILGVLRGRFPDHDVVTEERILEKKGSSHVWYVDPLDGTTNFAHGYPFFCASVGLAVDGVRVLGAVYDALRDELFTGERGVGAFLNGHRLKVTSARELIDGLLVTGFPYDLHKDVDHRLRLFVRFARKARGLRRDGAAALDLCYVAAGRFDGFFEERLQPWDMMAGSLLVEEAGGRVSRFDGSPLDLRGDEVVASNGPLHDAMLAVLLEDREGKKPPPAV
jgi:myo-inositol-1(or 4)-monophosphatase